MVLMQKHWGRLRNRFPQSNQLSTARGSHEARGRNLSPPAGSVGTVEAPRQPCAATADDDKQTTASKQRQQTELRTEDDNQERKTPADEPREFSEIQSSLEGLQEVRFTCQTLTALPVEVHLLPPH